MAWISVDQKLIGGKLRSLHKAIGCSQNEAIGILITLWLWGIDNADMDGLIISADQSDIARVLRAGLSPGLEAENVVEILIGSGWIDDIDGQLYLHDWEEWRFYYNQYVTGKKKHSERMKRYRNKGNASDVTCDISSDITSDVISDNSEKSSGQKEQIDIQKNKEKTGEKKESKYGPEFEEFWKIYPRKADKGQAFKTYSARLNDGYSPEDLKQAAEAYGKQCERDHTNQKYIKHAKTFLGTSLPFTEYMPKRQEEAVTAKERTSGIRSL